MKVKVILEKLKRTHRLGIKTLAGHWHCISGRLNTGTHSPLRPAYNKGLGWPTPNTSFSRQG